MVYPPISPVKVGEAVTKTIVILLGADALDSTVGVEGTLSTDTFDIGDTEFSCELLRTAAIENPASELDVEALGVSDGAEEAVTCTVVSTVTISVVRE